MPNTNCVIKNLVFEGGGVLGIAYIGVLRYLFERGIMQNLQRVAGTSAGAVTACVVSFNLPFSATKQIADSLDYEKVPQKAEVSPLEALALALAPKAEKLVADKDCIERLLAQYGWYSSDYFYGWLRDIIAEQFDPTKKAPPYTFADFQNPALHKNNRPFWELSVIGTDVSTATSKVFSFETTPHMEVAQAVRISMSVPVYFESATADIGGAKPQVFCDGGVMRNYPINLYDAYNFRDKIYTRRPCETLGARFNKAPIHRDIHNLIDYISALLECFTRAQKDQYMQNERDIARSIEIDTDTVKALDFNIKTNDETYNYLVNQGYAAAKKHFEHS